MEVGEEDEKYLIAKEKIREEVIRLRNWRSWVPII